jgi:hypothetical protein
MLFGGVGGVQGRGGFGGVSGGKDMRAGLESEGLL